jgi:uncharacterized protein
MKLRVETTGKIVRSIALIAVVALVSSCGPVTPPAVPSAADQSPTLVQSAPVSGARSDLRAVGTPAAAPSTGWGITVTGSGSVSAKPDRAIVSTGVQSRAGTAQEAHDTNNQAMQGVIGAIKEMGIPERSIQTNGISLYPATDEKNAIAGYIAMNNVTVTLDDLNQAGPVLDAAVKAGANSAGNVQFTMKDSTALRNQALTAAVADAKAKAAILAEAGGMTLTGITSISEAGTSEPMLQALAGKGAAAAGPTTPVEPGQITVAAQVVVVFGAPGS